MMQFQKSAVAVVALVVLVSQFSDSEARRHRHHSNHRTHHLHHHRSQEDSGSGSNTEIEIIQETSNEDGERQEEPVIVVAYRKVKNNEDDEDDDNSMSNSVEDGRRILSSSELEKFSSHLCLEDPEDVDRQIRHLGVKCICPKIKAPVCGSDDVTYHNRCFLKCRADYVNQTYHRYKPITLRKFGPC